MINDARLLYWYEYKKWIDSNMESAREIGRRCIDMVFKKPIVSKESEELLYIKEIFGL